jgi:hypothetical protein
MPRSQSSIFIYPRLLSLFRNKICFTEWGYQPHAQPPLPWRTGVSLLVWSFSFVLSGLGDPASSYATAGTARRITGTRKPPHHDMVETPSRRASLIRWSNSKLFLILHISFPIYIGPNIFRRICLSKMQSRIASYWLSVQVSEAYVTTGLMRVSCILIFVLLFNNIDFKSFAFA